MRFDFADNGGVGHVLASVLWDVFLVNDVEGVGPIDPFADALRPYYTYTLAQTANLVGVQSGPDGIKAWVLAELAVHEVLASLVIKDRHCPHGEECLGEDAARRQCWSDRVCQCGAQPCTSRDWSRSPQRCGWRLRLA